MSTFAKITDKTSEAELTAIVNGAEAAVAEGFSPNPFACKLPLGDNKGTIQAKEWRKWEKNGNKGLILSITALFEGVNVTDRVTCTTLEEWKSYKIGGTIEVTVANKTDKAEKFAKIKATTVETV
jgi:hypothetical protein